MANDSEKSSGTTTTIILQNNTSNSLGIASFIFGLISIFFLSPIFVPIALILGVIAVIKKQLVWGVLGLICAVIGFITSPILLGIFGLATIGALLEEPRVIHAPSSPISSVTIPKSQIGIAGDWILRREDEPNSNPVAWMKIELDGTRIVVHGDSWSGEGSFDEQRGFYNWRFSDGRSGLTELFIDNNSIIHGKVRGSGISWDYQGTRK